MIISRDLAELHPLVAAKARALPGIDLRWPALIGMPRRRPNCKPDPFCPERSDTPVTPVIPSQRSGSERISLAIRACVRNR